LFNPFPTVSCAHRERFGLSTFVASHHLHRSGPRDPYIQQYSAGCSMKFPGQVLLDVSYVGSQTAAWA
jgi:hypothetical protein